MTLPKPAPDKVRIARRTPPRSVRVPTELWKAAGTKAASAGETITDVIVRALRAYTEGGKK